MHHVESRTSSLACPLDIETAITRSRPGNQLHCRNNRSLDKSLHRLVMIWCNGLRLFAAGSKLKMPKSPSLDTVAKTLEGCGEEAWKRKSRMAAACGKVCIQILQKRDISQILGLIVACHNLHFIGHPLKQDNATLPALRCGAFVGLPCVLFLETVSSYDEVLGVFRADLYTARRQRKLYRNLGPNIIGVRHPLRYALCCEKFAIYGIATIV